MNTLRTIVSAVAAGSLAACAFGASEVELANPDESPNTPVESVDPRSDLGPGEIDPDQLGLPADDPSMQSGNPASNRCQLGRTYSGFGGIILGLDRNDQDQGWDRARVKPFSAMAAEYQRVTGRTPTLLASMGPTFGEPPARWYIEPESSAVSLFSAYRVGFSACLEMTGAVVVGTATPPAQYGVAPSTAAATTECTTWAQKFWSREPQQGEIDACVKMATVSTAAETTPRRRWAYVCASVLSSAGFLAY